MTEEKRNYNRIFLIPILLLGLFLRVFNISKEGLFRDEVMDVFGSLPSLSVSGIVNYWAGDSQFPAYFVLLHYWSKIFGTTESAIRFLSVIFGIASVYLVFLLGRKLFNEETGIIAGLLIALSPINLFYSQFADPYSMATFFSLLSFLYLLKGLEGDSIRAPLAYGFFILVTLFTSSIFISVLLCQLLFLAFLFSERKDRRVNKLIIVIIGVLILYLPFLYVIVKKTFTVKSTEQFSGFQSAHDYFYNVWNYLKLCGGKIYRELKYKDSAIPGNLFINIGALLFAFLFIIGALWRLPDKKAGRWRLLLLSGLIVSLAFPLVHKFTFASSYGPFMPRHILYASCFYYLLIGRGLSLFSKRSKVIFIVLILCLSIISLSDYYRIDKGINWRKITNYIKDNISGEEMIVLNNQNYYAVDMMLYYAGGFRLIGLRWDDHLAKIFNDSFMRPAGFKLAARKRAESIKQQSTKDLAYPGVWLVDQDMMPASDAFLSMQSAAIGILRKKYRLLEERTFYNEVHIYHFRLEN